MQFNSYEHNLFKKFLKKYVNPVFRVSFTNLIIKKIIKF